MPLGAPASAPATGVRAMIVDDAVVVRGLVSRWLGEVGVEVVGVHHNGAAAVDGARRLAAEGRAPDVVVLDIEMPVMGGLEALPLLLRALPGAGVIIASSLTQQGADVTLRALGLGASDYVLKPSSNRGVTVSQDFRLELVTRVLALGARRRGAGAAAAWPASPAAGPAGPAALPAPRAALATAPPRAPEPPVTFSPWPRARPSLVVIGASTGGPQAVMAVLARARAALRGVPVLVAQHMPGTFTPMFADHLRRNLGLDAAEAVEGEPVEPGRVYVAPGGRHLRLREGPPGARPGPRVALGDDDPIRYCRPSVDALFGSAARVAGGGALGALLSGMGTDGALGALAIARAGGAVLAQDEASSVVWGMPGAAVRAGACAACLPLDALADALARLLTGREARDPAPGAAPAAWSAA